MYVCESVCVCAMGIGPHAFIRGCVLEQITLNSMWYFPTKRFDVKSPNQICVAYNSRSRSHIKMYGDVFVASPNFLKYPAAVLESNG